MIVALYLGISQRVALAQNDSAAPSPSATTAAVPSATGGAPTTETSEPPESAVKFSIAALVGVSSDHYGFGLGVRGGAQFRQGFYVGGLLMYHVGTSYGVAPYSSGHSSAIQFGAEGGYAFPVGPVIIRPFGAIGILDSIYSGTSQAAVPGATAISVSGSHTELALWFGGTVAYRIAETPWAVGGELRVLLPLDQAESNFGVFAMASYRF